MPDFDRNSPYDDLPRLPPRADIESVDIMRACIKASRSLAELQGLVSTIPDKRILLELLPLQESESSSAIENIVSSKKRLFMAVSGDPEKADRSTREILGYNKALLTSSGRIPDLETIRNICSSIKGEAMDYRNPGDEQVGLFSAGSRVAVYTPPSGASVNGLMKNLMEYIFTDDDVDPLIKMAVIHYQFEAIHPFFDGNGRTGRILNIIYLQYSKLITDPLLFISDYIIENKARYYELLGNVTKEGDWESWILFMLEAVDIVSRRTVSRIGRITSLIKDCKTGAKSLGVPEACIDAVFSNPYCTIGNMMDSLGCSRPSASKYLKALESVDMLRSVRTGKGLVYVNNPLIEEFSRAE
ncbi:MAG: Fic family protein [Thermoplasmata archaeon]|nr:Fic family protein [Thermoplasmata archaeon]